MAQEIDRRGFLQQGAGGLALATLAAPRVLAEDSPRVVVGLIGAGGMGSGHLRALSARPDVEVAWVCDVDAKRLQAGGELVAKNSGKAPRETGDLRQVLADPRVEAVWIATPDHWHAPAAILALDAGKHVYVEKPCCHNLREGQLLEAAVQRSQKRLQVGTQSRSSPTVRAAIERIQSGEIGEILVSKAWNSQLRGSIGKSAPAAPPAGLDFEMWLGPTPAAEYRPNLLHGVWRWWHDYGCGDMGNDGVHDIDVAVWGLGVDSLPTRVACLGGKAFFDDDMQFPDTQYAVFEYPRADRPGVPRQLIFEQRIWSPYVQEGYENGAAFYGTKGMPRNKLIDEQQGRADIEPHHTNFLQAIRDPKIPLHADVRAGTLSAGLVHLGNVAARVQRTLQFDPGQGDLLGDPQASEMLGRRYRAGHWATPGRS